MTSFHADPSESLSPEWEKLIEEGRSVLRRGDHAAAEAIETRIFQALTALENATGPSRAAHSTSETSRDRHAEAWIVLGHLREVQPAKLPLALEAYSQAGNFSNVTPRILLLAALNRGNALSRLGRTEEALAAYAQAVEAGQRISGPDTATKLNLGALHLNRGAVLLSLKRSEAVDAFRAAVDGFEQVSRTTADAEHNHAKFLAAGARMNLAASLGGLGQLPEARRLLSEVEASVGSQAQNDMRAADLMLRSARLFCEWGGSELSRVNLATCDVTWLKNTVALSTDCAESALSLAMDWEARGVQLFRPAVAWFLYFAATLYAHHQPRFLAEFLSELLRSEKTPTAWRESNEYAGIARSAIETAQRGMRGKLFQDPQAEDAQVHVETLESLRQAQAAFAQTR